MSQPDHIDTMIQDIIAGYPGPEPGTRQPYPVRRFLGGLALFQVNVILLWLLVWLVAHVHG